jgi:hypothetical protein
MQTKDNKAQSTLEYLVLVALLVGALWAMRVCLVRAVQGKYRQGADVFGQGAQYERGVTQVTIDGVER